MSALWCLQSLEFWNSGTDKIISCFIYLLFIIFIFGRAARLVGSFCFFNLFYLMYFLFFLAVLGLCCCARAFLQLRQVGSTRPCGARASHCGGLSRCGAWAVGARASVVAVRGLSSCGSRALEHRLSSCGARA